MSEKALIELVRDCNRNITPADRHGLLKLIGQQAARIAELEQQVSMLRTGDTCARMCEGTAYRIGERQAKARIAELEAARTAYAYEFPLNADGEPDVGNVHANIRAMKAKLAAMEAQFEIPDYAMPPDGQEWALVGSAVAYHLIERHAENWAHAGQLMEAWRDANSPVPDVIREALEATFEQRAGYLTKVSAAIRAIAASEPKKEPT